MSRRELRRQLVDPLALTRQLLRILIGNVFELAGVAAQVEQTAQLSVARPHALETAAAIGLIGQLRQEDLVWLDVARRSRRQTDQGANQTAHILVTSYLSAGQGDAREILDTFDPYPETIFIYGNRFEGGGEAPDREQLLMVRDAVYGPEGRLPEVVWDGWVNPENTVDGQLKPEYALCIDNGEIGFINIDNGNGNANISTDMAPHACTHDRLSAVELPASFGSGE